MSLRPTMISGKIRIDSMRTPRNVMYKSHKGIPYVSKTGGRWFRRFYIREGAYEDKKRGLVDYKKNRVLPISQIRSIK